MQHAAVRRQLIVHSLRIRCERPFVPSDEEQALIEETLPACFLTTCWSSRQTRILATQALPEPRPDHTHAFKYVAFFSHMS